MNYRRIIGVILIIIGTVLFLDQLYIITFGVIPIGGFLGDLSYLDPTGLDIIHHWMFGLVLECIGWWLVR